MPPAFRNSPKQPDPQVPLEQLLERGQFRAAAIAAVQELTGSAAGASGRDGVDPRDAKSIFDLLYTRLACLTLIDATPLAAQEVKALEDLNNPSIYVDEATGQHLAPWKLRVLNVRLQALGFGDHRRAVMSYHDLAREARAEISKAAARHDDTARELWKSRLHDLGIQVAGALIDMDDLPGAAHHLDAMPDGGGNKKLPLSRALLWLHLGNAAKARECAARCSGEHDGAHTDTLIQALCDMADADYEAALGKWQGLRETLGAGDEMVGVNTAVCLLYLGRMHEASLYHSMLALRWRPLSEHTGIGRRLGGNTGKNRKWLTARQGRDMLQELVGTGASSHTLLFNLATMYELCTDKHRNLKTRLAERVARLDESPAGWEKMNADFKL